jgi:DNA polymerase-3 subunit epsilon
MWWSGSALGFDTETDGRDPTEARAITGALVSLTPGRAPLPMEQLLQPERDIDPEAVKIHGITTEYAQKNGIPRLEGIRWMAAAIAEGAGEDRPLVGHNVSYDLTLLDREMRRLNIGSVGTDLDTGFCSLRMGSRQARFPVIDTYVLDKAVDRYRPGKRQLSFVAAHYGVPMKEGEAHGATADVIASLRIAITIANRARMALGYIAENGGPDISSPMVFQHHPFMNFYGGRRDPLEIVRAFAGLGVMTLEELHLSQIDWAASQAKGLREHFIKNPDKGDAGSVDGSWPYRPIPTNRPVEDVNTTLV